MNKRAKSNSIRIIAGTWRGRRLPVLDSEGLRPTTDRVRETIFNWMMHDIHGANCLDLFAGSGALGFECLSRGAKFVQFVESQHKVMTSLSDNVSSLLSSADGLRANIVCQDALSFLSSVNHKRYDIVFIDPPFQSNLAVQAVQLLVNNNWLNDNALVYLEKDSKLDAIEVPSSWKVYRQGSAGQSNYTLYSC